MPKNSTLDRRALRRLGDGSVAVGGWGRPAKGCKGPSYWDEDEQQCKFPEKEAP